MDGPDYADSVLRHYGVKGMKWGVRKKRSSGPSPVTVTAVPGKRVQTQGGHGQPAHEDAIRIAGHKQKAKKSTTDALSTAELKQLVERMNLEQQYARLTPKTPSQKAVSFISDMLVGVGKQQATRVANDYATQQVSAAMKRTSK